MSTRSLLPLALILSFLASACSAHVHGRPHKHAARPAVTHHHHAGARVVVVPKGHRHTKSCGHYRHRGTWYHLERHVHGTRCGHALVRGVWVVKR